MDWATDKVVNNEIAFRSANNGLRDKFVELGGHDLVPFLCECGEFTCTTIVRVSLELYASIRDQPAWFLISPGHKQLDSERVVEQGDGYEIIEETGAAGELARARWVAHQP